MKSILDNIREALQREYESRWEIILGRDDVEVPSVITEPLEFPQVEAKPVTE